MPERSNNIRLISGFHMESYVAHAICWMKQMHDQVGGQRVEIFQNLWFHKESNTRNLIRLIFMRSFGGKPHLLLVK